MVQIFNGLVESVFDGAGAPISGAQLFIYEAGTSNKLTTYTDSALTTPASNPLVADSAGRFATLYGNPDDYKFVLTSATDTDPPTSPTRTVDNYTISATASFSGGINASGETEHLINAQTGTSYTIVDGDRGKLVTFSNAAAVAVTLPQANSSTFEAGWYFEAFNLGAGTVTITPTTSTINGLSVFTLPTNCGVKIYSDGTNYFIRGLDRIAPGVNAQTGTSYTIVPADLEKLVTFSNSSAIAVTLPQANSTTFKDGWNFTASNVGTANVTITPTTSTIGGASSLVLASGQSAKITSDGTNYQSSLISNGLVLLSTQTASASATIDFTSEITTAYKAYVVDIIEAKPVTDAVNLYMRFSQSSTFLTTSGDYAFNYIIGSSSTTLARTGDATSTFIGMTGSVGNSTGEAVSGRIIIYDPTASSGYKKAHWHLTTINNSGVIETQTGDSAVIKNETACDGVRFLFSSGNIASGTFKLYGVL